MKSCMQFAVTGHEGRGKRETLGYWCKEVSFVAVEVLLKYCSLKLSLIESECLHKRERIILKYVIDIMELFTYNKELNLAFSNNMGGYERGYATF